SPGKGTPNSRSIRGFCRFGWVIGRAGRVGGSVRRFWEGEAPAEPVFGEPAASGAGWSIYPALDGADSPGTIWLGRTHPPPQISGDRNRVTRRSLPIGYSRPTRGRRDHAGSRLARPPGANPRADGRPGSRPGRTPCRARGAGPNQPIQWFGGNPLAGD